MNSRFNARPVLLAIAAIGLAGCGITLPNGQLAEYHRKTNVFGVVWTADVTNVKNTDEETAVGDVAVGLSFPGFDHSQSAKGVKIEKQKK